jgi:hypothetical protein
MAKESLAKQMSMLSLPGEEEITDAGPFVAISREFGCGGFSLGLLLMDVLNDEVTKGSAAWQIYHKEILESLANETGVGLEIIQRQRREKPRLLADFFRTLAGKKKDRVPSGMEIRNRMTSIIRELAIEGNAILVGQSSTGATSDLPNGLSVRLEAPEAWRVKQIAFREGLSETQAKIRLQEESEQREYLYKIYERKYPRKPAFNLSFDCSKFSLAQIATLIHRAMKLRGYV